MSRSCSRLRNVRLSPTVRMLSESVRIFVFKVFVNDLYFSFGFDRAKTERRDFETKSIAENKIHQKETQGQHF